MKEIEKIDIEKLARQLEEIQEQLASAAEINAIIDLKQALDGLDLRKDFHTARQQVLACSNLLEQRRGIKPRESNKPSAPRVNRGAGKPRPIRKINEILSTAPNKWFGPEDVYEQGKDYFAKIGIRQTDMNGVMAELAEKNRIQVSSGKYKIAKPE